MIHCMNVHLSEKILLLNNFGLAQWFDLNLLQSSQSHVKTSCCKYRQVAEIQTQSQTILLGCSSSSAPRVFRGRVLSVANIFVAPRAAFAGRFVDKSTVWSDKSLKGVGHFRVAFSSVPKRVFARNHSYGHTHIYIVFRLYVHFHVNQTHFHMKGFA